MSLLPEHMKQVLSKPLVHGEVLFELLTDLIRLSNRSRAVVLLQCKPRA